jgi:ferredoxin
MICPLGALYALAARRSPFKRIVDRCMACDRCSNECRMGAIREDLSYERPECVLCMDCVYACPMHGVRFGFGQARAAEAPAGSGSPENQAGPGGRISRAQFLALAFSAAAILAPFSKSRAAAVDPETDDTERLGIIRPPAALEERDFKDRCVRCGNCMKVCVTNGLQPTMFETGYSGVWTPRLVPEIGYCEYKCTLCGRTCPTGAIPELSLEAKMKTRLGLAQLDRSICLPWADKKECIVCQEHCPVSEKAIVLDTDPASGVQRPRVVEERCVGCGICQNKCPVRPVRAITVSPAKSYRTRVSRGKRRR